jgi:hypothetical protein
MAEKSLVFNQRFTILLLTVIAFLLIPPFISDQLIEMIIYTFTLSLMFVQSVYATMITKRFLWIGITAGVIIFSMIWLSPFIDLGKGARMFTLTLLIMFFSIIIISLGKFLFKSKEVTADFILISIIIYLLTGIIGGFIFALLDDIYPQILNVPTERMGDVMNFMYYSFVTMTTLGYGDISPIIPESRIVAVLLAVTGQLYLAVIVALIVGKFVGKIKD